MSLKETFHLFFIGLGTIFFWLFWNITKLNGLGTQNIIKGYVYLAAIFFVFLVYHPHFIHTYKECYFRGRKYVSKNFNILIALPIVLIMLFTFLILDTFFLNRLSPLSLEVSLYFTAILIAWHFSCQTVSTIIHFSKNMIIVKKKICILFFLTFILGLVSSISHFGNYPFYKLPTHSLNINPDIIFYSRILFLSLHFIFIGVYHKNISYKSFIPWVAFLVWTLTPTFTEEFFYLVPLFHSLEASYFYLKRHTVKKGFFDYIKLLFISVIIFGFLLNIVANLEFEYNNNSLVFSKLFIGFLLIVNIHHALAERLTWQRHP